MAKPKLLIADGTGEYGAALKQLLQSEYQITLCHDGIQALNLLRDQKPDILVLDLILPELDGISLLHSPVVRELHPRVLALSSFVNPYITDALEQLAVSYLIRIPCSPRAVCEQIRALTQYTPACTVSPVSRAIADYMTGLGFSSMHIGASLIRDAILIQYERPGAAITKHIYPELARKYRLKPTQVERDMRNAIERAWDASHPGWQTHFPGSTRPSNGVFLTRIAQILPRERT